MDVCPIAGSAAGPHDPERTSVKVDGEMMRLRLWMSLLAGIAVMSVGPASAAAQQGHNDRPSITRAPKVRGNAVAGQPLEAWDARWQGDWPLSAGYVWLRCDSQSLWSCDVLWSANAATYTLTAADVGKYMRVWLGVSNREGRDDEVSAAIGPVAAPPPPPPSVPAPTPTPDPLPPPPVAEPAQPVGTPAPAAPAGDVAGRETRTLRTMRPRPVVRIRGWLVARGAMVTLLTVKAPRGARIAIRCRGRSCPRERWARAAAVTRVKAFEGVLRAGVRLVVRVTRPGFVGKHTLIRIRAGKRPARIDRCLYPGSKGPRTCPS
jgi:hypothetical protein